MIIKLNPVGGRKSFYEKAFVESVGNADVLFSYCTPVAAWKNGKFYRLWDSFSKTTMRHVNAFSCLVRNIPMRKKDWEKLPVTPRYQIGL